MMTSIPRGKKQNKTKRTRILSISKRNCSHLQDSATAPIPRLGAKLRHNFNSMGFSTELILSDGKEELLWALATTTSVIQESHSFLYLPRGGERASGHPLVASNHIFQPNYPASFSALLLATARTLYVLLEKSVRITDTKTISFRQTLAIILTKGLGSRVAL